MSAAPIPAEPTPAQRAADAEHIRQATHELIDLGLSFARMLHSQAEALATPAEAPEAKDPEFETPEAESPKAGPDLPTIAAAFENTTRGVRRAILLARELAKPLPQPRSASDAPLDRTYARKRIIRGVEDAISRGHRIMPRDVEALEAELLDRLDRPEIDDDIARRPIEHIVADIARDLGVGFPLDEPLRVWKRRTPEDIEQLEARAAEPSPAEPRPPRTATRAPAPKPIELPKDDAEAVAFVLRYAASVRDG